MHFTFLLALPIIAFAFSRSFIDFRQAELAAGVAPEDVRGNPLLWGLLVALALFASVLVHELAHAFVALRSGSTVRDITLLMIGGVTSIVEPPRDPNREAVMALVGPVASIVVAIVSYLVYLALDPSMASLRLGFFYLAALNLIIGLFNLIPAFPMDGGRVLRGLLSPRIGHVRATRLAATLGKVFAVVMVFIAFLRFDFFLMMIAFFIYSGADAEAGQVVAQTVLGGVTVADLARPAPTVLDANATLDDAAASMSEHREDAVLVKIGEGRLGVVTLDQLARVPQGKRASVTVSELVRDAPVVDASANVWDAMKTMRASRMPLALVVEGTRLAGALHESDVVRALRLHQLETSRGGRPVTPGAGAMARREPA